MKFVIMVTEHHASGPLAGQPPWIWRDEFGKIMTFRSCSAALGYASYLVCTQTGAKFCVRRAP